MQVLETTEALEIVCKMASCEACEECVSILTVSKPKVLYLINVLQQYVATPILDRRLHILYTALVLTHQPAS